MTGAKELDPAVRLNALDEAIETLRFNVRHLIAEDDKDDALRTLEVARDVMASVAETLASLPRLEALSTAPVALEAGWNTDLDAMPHALTLLFKAHDPDEPEGVVSLGIRGEEPQRLIAWSFLPSAIHPAPSRAVIDREQAANLAYRLCAETRHVTLGDSIAAALRSLPSNAPSLGEARLAEGEPVFTYTRTFNAIAAAVEWKPNNAFGISVRKFVEAFGPNPSHVQAEAGEAVVTTPPKISELANDLWEALFGIMRGAVPDDLTNEVLNQLAARMAVAYSISERAAP